MIKVRLILSWFVGLAIVSLLILGEAAVTRQRARKKYHIESEV